MVHRVPVNGNVRKAPHKQEKHDLVNRSCFCSYLYLFFGILVICPTGPSTLVL